MNDRASILSKIQKLLGLAKSANPHEAELAMAQAQILMARHAISEAEAIAAGEQADEPFVRAGAIVWGMRLARWRYDLAVCMGEAASCRSIHNRSRAKGERTWMHSVVPLGTEANCHLARFMYTWAEGEITRLATRACKGMNRLERLSWYVGVVQGIGIAMEEAKQKTMAEEQAKITEGGLRTLDRRAKELETFREAITKGKKHKRPGFDPDPFAFMDGFETGKGIQVPRGRGVGGRRDAIEDQAAV